VNTAIADPLIGRVLEGRYRITGQLARGGMSTVYGAVDQRLDRLVAVKVMASSLSADPAFTDRFTREARAAAKLTHLNAVSVYDQGADGGHVFLVMELVSGRTLRDLLRERGRLSPAEAVSVMEPVLAALAAAHRAGLVHRDVKPENILLSDDGVVKVADFGLARAVESDDSTRTGLMMGTVAYCSPEQISRGRTDQRSDVYSAGIVLYELLVGSTPYKGESAMNIAYQHVHGTVPRPSSQVRGIAPELDALVRRATDSEPGGRPLDAGAFLAELADVRNDVGLPVVPVPPRTRTRHSSSADTARTRHVAPLSSTTDPLRRAPDVHDTVVHDRHGEDMQGPPPPVVIPPPKRPAKQRTVTARRRRRALIALLVVLLLGASSAVGGWWLFSGRFSRVPNVAGQSQSAATSALQQAGFKISASIEQQFSETVPKSLVLGTDPDSGARLARGRTVQLRISKGQDRVQILDVSGKSQADAVQLLQTLRIHLLVVQASNDTVPAGTAVGTNPAASTLVKPGSQLQLIISTGPAQVQVPGVVGKKQADATTVLQAASFKVTATQDYSNTVPADSVISQNPAAESSLTKFSTVTIVVSKGPQTVQIPAIAGGTPVAQAQAQLQQLGLKVTINKQFGGKLGEVVGMDPAAGTTVNIGSTVTLYVV
jgi:beta-lactam-binding protein with PASTA domain